MHESEYDPAAISLRGLSVSFGSNRVLSGIDLDIKRGQVTALLGANGAGKSTLIKALSGINTNYEGRVSINGEVVRITSPIVAQSLGISTVHQKVSDGIVPTLSVIENLALDSFADRRTGLLRRKKAQRELATRALDRLDIRWQSRVLDAKARALPISAAQLVVLARTLLKEPSLLILDEPTSALDAGEVEKLFRVLRDLKARGLAILYVSHRFGELEALADRVVVLRDGHICADATPPFDWPDLVATMLARNVAEDRPAAATATKASAGTQRHVVARARNMKLLRYSAPMSIDFHRGEILGVLGLVGAGKSELCEYFFGVRPLGEGSLELDGKPYTPKSPQSAIKSGVALVPEDRQAQSIVPSWSLMRIISLPFLKNYCLLGVVPSRRRETKTAESVISEVGVVTTGPGALIEELSGGNQQKVVVGRWLDARPRLLLLDEPFRGVDIGARHDIGLQLRHLAHSGSSVVVLSSDVDEVLDVADRVAVLRLGEVVLDCPRESIDRADLTDALSQ